MTTTRIEFQPEVITEGNRLVDLFIYIDDMLISAQAITKNHKGKKWLNSEIESCKEDSWLEYSKRDGL